MATGRRVNVAAAANLRPTSMELGGKSALIVFEDADVADAVEWAMVRTPPPLLRSPYLSPHAACPLQGTLLLRHSPAVLSPRCALRRVDVS